MKYLPTMLVLLLCAGCVQLKWEQDGSETAMKAGRQNSEGDSLPGVRLGLGFGASTVEQSDKGPVEEEETTTPVIPPLPTPPE